MTKKNFNAEQIVVLLRQIEVPMSQGKAALMAGREPEFRSTRGGVEAEGASVGCCGGPALAGVDACCAEDTDAKRRGKVGCGCS